MAPTLRLIRPEYPRNTAGRQQLTSILSRMGLDFLLELPWNVAVDSVLKEQLFYTVKRRRGDNIRPNAHTWTEAVVSRAYHTPIEGGTFKDGETPHRRYVASKFKDGTFKRRNGWLISHCIDPVLRAVFAFLIPILNPENQVRVSLTLATTIVVSMEETETINWSNILFKVIQHQIELYASRQEKGKLSYTYLCSFVAHIYWSENCLNPEERLQLLPVFTSTVNERRGEEAAGPSDPELAPAEESWQSDSAILETVCHLLDCDRETVIAAVLKTL